MSRMAFVLMAFVALPISATMSGCPDLFGLPPSPKVAVLQASPSTLRIIFTNGFGSSTNDIVTIGAAVVSVVGNEVRVTQLFSDVRNPSEVPPLGFAMCQTEIIDLPTLPAGNYTLKWTYSCADTGICLPAVTLPFSLPAVSIPALGVRELAALALVLAVIGAAFLRQ